MPKAYCDECHWQREAEADSTTDLDQAMIDHYVETGHSPIERATDPAATQPDPTSTDEPSVGRIGED
ncbi:hypothetical protein ACLI4Z_03770 [Natrialbaceae archaeon A-arb3/5]